MLADRNYAELRRQGIPAQPPGNIPRYEFDAIVIASSFAGARNAIYKELAAEYGDAAVHVMDESLVKSEAVMSAFGLTCGR